jgi:hypothetical protein
MTASTWSETKKKIKKVFLWLVTLAIIVIGIFVYWKYFYIYSDGYRAGLLQKFSHKGNIFKTYEGEIILSSVTSTNNVALASEKFYFSVTDKSLASLLDTLQGQFVIVHYVQRNGVVFWRGDSEYFVDNVKRRQ